jgi:hypothetical protein
MFRSLVARLAPSPLRRSTAFLGLALVLVTFSGAVCPDHEPIAATGTVQHLDLEGGFWGIVADDGAKYDPVNLAPEFQVEGLRVSFRAKLAKEQVSFHMWGTRIEISSIRRVEP